MTPGDRRGIEVVTFGCRLNHVESAEMAAAAAAAGHRALTIVNTCAVTAEAARQGRQAVRRLVRERPGVPLAVTGCAAAVEPHAFRALAGVDHLVGNTVKADPETWRALAPADAGKATGPAPRSPAIRTRGFVEVQNGCDHRCTFCIIPFGRGASRSAATARIEARIGTLLAEGVREIVLTGVDITAFGADRPERPSLGSLVRHLLATFPHLPRLRLSSLDCVEADPELLDAIAGEPRLMPHLHLSLQSGADLILKRMRRRHSRADAIALAARLRRLRPDIVLGADLIAGFPTETETDFADSLSLVEACGLTHLHVFPYSPRPGTAAARMPAVPGAIVRERALRLRAAGDLALRRHLDRQVGRRLRVLMERGGTGRAEDFTPVRPMTPPPPAGTLVEVLVEEHDGAILRGPAGAAEP